MSPSNQFPFIAVLIVSTSFCSHASAGCRTKTVTNSADEIQLVVPFAVPVGVPVAPFAPYFYSYQQTKATSVGAYDGKSDASRPMPPDVDTQKADDPSPSSQYSSPVSPPSPSPMYASLVTTRCVTCHGGPAPKAGLSLENPTAMKTADRLNAIHAVVTGKMPKGAHLAVDELQRVVAELSTVANDEVKSSSAQLIPAKVGQ
jgi:mono/diheme cytochrome c family protein